MTFFLEKMKQQKPLGFTLLLATLGVGILIGTLVNTGVQAGLQNSTVAPGATPLAIPLVKELSHLPVILDPSHATGKRSLVPALARAGVAIGADGLIVEVHPNPQYARSDGRQSLKPARFEDLMGQVSAVASAVGRAI